MLKKKSSFILFSFLLLLFMAGFLPISHLAISSDGFYCVTRHNTFSLRWRHSVEKQLWYEHYHYQDQQLELIESWLQTFGAGTPSQAEGITSAPKGYIGYKHNIKLNELNWVVSPNMQGEIYFGDHRIPIATILPAYSTVNIQPKNSPLAFYLLRSACNV